MPLLQVDAQTDTPVINTPTPGGITPTPYGWDEMVISLDFATSDQFFSQTEGNRIAGQGFVAENGLLHINGNGNEYGPITKIQLRYTVFGSGSLQIVFSHDSMSLDARLVNFSTCSNCSNMIIELENIIVDDFDIEVTVSGEFTLHELNIYTFGGDETPPTPEIVNGCPVLSPELIAKLDPAYMAQCSRCFTTPTPVRANSIPTQVVNVPTLDLTAAGTYQIPVIVSGTPQTPTPVGLPGGGFPTETYTPAPTFTPSFDVITFDFTVTAFSWISPPPWGDQSSSRLSLGWSSVYNGGGFLREYVQLNYAGTIPNVTYVTITASVPSGLPGGIDIQLFDTNGASIEALWASGHIDAGSHVTLPLDIAVPSTMTGIGINAFSGVVGESHTWYLEKIEFETTDLVTVTPSPTVTPTSTGVPWFATPDVGESDCTVPVYRDDTPAVTVPGIISDAGYSCYTIVPDMQMQIPNRGTIGIDGLQLCVDWITFPELKILGIGLSLDWLLVGVIAALVRYLLNF